MRPEASYVIFLTIWRSKHRRDEARQNAPADDWRPVQSESAGFTFCFFSFPAHSLRAFSKTKTPVQSLGWTNCCLLLDTTASSCSRSEEGPRAADSPHRCLWMSQPGQTGLEESPKASVQEPSVSIFKWLFWGHRKRHSKRVGHAQVGCSPEHGLGSRGADGLPVAVGEGRWCHSFSYAVRTPASRTPKFIHLKLESRCWTLQSCPVCGGFWEFGLWSNWVCSVSFTIRKKLTHKNYPGGWA